MATEIKSCFFVDPKIMQDKPVGMNIDGMRVIDPACPQSELGVGALE